MEFEYKGVPEWDPLGRVRRDIGGLNERPCHFVTAGDSAHLYRKLLFFFFWTAMIGRLQDP